MELTASYYDERFREGYADYWPQERYTRVAALIKSLDLPQTGTALDFGCGNGSFTKLLADTLPGWTVVGADLSSVAVANCLRKYPALTFLQIDGLDGMRGRFDLIWSHHVLEHVPDLDATWQRFGALVSERGQAVHVMPCGNAGSLEHRLCLLRRDGIDESREGRFYCDDGPHLRRATTRSMSAAAGRAGFTLTSAWYSQHYWSQLWPYAQKDMKYLLKLTSPSAAVDTGAALRLVSYRAAFMTLALGCLPTLYRWKLDDRGYQHWSDRLRHAVALSLTPISTPLSRWLRRKAEQEWAMRRDDPAGGEMYLHFQTSRASANLP